MRHASYHPAEAVSQESVLRREKTRPSSIFGIAAVLAALHHSRRLQAQRTLRQYQHLIADPKEVSLDNFIQNIGGDKNAGE